MKMSKNPAKYEALMKQYLRSILDISGKFGGQRRQISLHLEELDQFRPVFVGPVFVAVEEVFIWGSVGSSGELRTFGLSL